MKFTSLANRTIARRGLVLFVACPQTCDRDSLLSVIGETAEIDGKMYAVKGVESHAVQIIKQGVPIGLLVEPHDSPD